jgi:hypothetical protein
MAMAIPLVVEAVEGATAASAAGAATAGTAAGAGESAMASRLARGAISASGKIDLGPGEGGQNNAMQISKEDVKRILHSSAAVSAVTARAEEVCRQANAQAITREAEYEVVVQNRGDTTRCRAIVRPANYYAIVDDHYHSTLLKAAAQAGSDAIP